MERTGVSIGMFQTSHLSFDARRTECVGQTIFSVMTPVSKKTKSLPERHLEHQTTFSLVKMHVLCVHYTRSNGKRRGEYRNVSNELFEPLSFDVRRTECVGQTVFSVVKRHILCVYMC